MFPLNGGNRPMMPQQQPMQNQPVGGPAMQGAPQAQPAAPQSRAAMLMAAALQAIAQEGFTPAVEVALEGFFKALETIHRSASPAPGGAPQGSEQMGFAALPNAAAHNAPVPGGRY